MSHPLLPCGYNSAAIDGDELNGAGVNEPVWPLLFDTFEAMTVIVTSEELHEAVEICPDFVIDPQNSLLILPSGWPIFVPAHDAWLDPQAIAVESGLIVLPRRPQTQAVTPESDRATARDTDIHITFRAPDRTYVAAPGAWLNPQMIVAQSNTIVWPHEARRQQVPSVDGTVAVPAPGVSIMLAPDTKTQIVRKSA